MASQRIPESYDPLIALLEDAADGARDHGPAVGLKQNTETEIRADLEALAGRLAGPGNVPPALPGLKAEWNLAKSGKVSGGGGFRAAKNAGRTVASACVNVLKPRLGNQWNNAWQAAGFTNHSLEIPENPLTLLQQLRAYFTANPTHEKPDLAPGLHATADACHAAALAISSASSSSNNSNSGAGGAKKALEDGIAAGRKRLTGLRTELSQLLGSDDERWYAFGFERPGDPETPEIPDNLTGTAGAAGSGNLFGDWDDSRRSESYRAIVSDATSGAKIAEKLTNESEAHFAGLPLGQALKLTITAINSAGESRPGEPLAFTLN
ncbi:MAG: hypothetical protein V4584_03380 [Verrucomicrobiota bacterium]